jgi:hypothetical protein
MLDVNGRRTVQVEGREWTLTALPFAVLLDAQRREQEARSGLVRASRVEDGKHVALSDSPSDRGAFADALAHVMATDAAVRLDVLRWGLRAYATGAHGEDVTLDGRSYRVLTHDAASVLAGWSAPLCASLAAEVMRQNALSVDDMLGFLRPSGS